MAFWLRPVPDRLCTEKGSKFYDPEAVRNIEVEFNGIRQINCIVEYCVSEGWIRRRKVSALGKVATDQFHQPIIKRFDGQVRPYWKA